MARPNHGRPPGKIQFNVLLREEVYHLFRETATALGYNNKFASFFENLVLPVFLLNPRELRRRLGSALSQDPALFDSDEARFYAGQLSKDFAKIAAGEDPGIRMS